MEDSCNHKNGASPRMEKHPGEKLGPIVGLAMVDKHPREELGMNIIDHNQDGSLSTIYSTIYRVPPEILSSDIGNAHKHFYRPKAVCIGPYFYSIREDQSLKSMQDHKRACVNKLASKYGRTEEDFFDECLMRMKELEGPVRSSYSEDINSWLSSEEDLAEMLVLDGCFILNLLLKKEKEKDEDDSKKVIGRLWIWELVRYDLLLLENQIPFFVIQELHKILLKTTDDVGINGAVDINDAVDINLVNCAFRYFKGLDPWRKQQLPEPVSYLKTKDVHHLLHLTYKIFLPPPHSVNFSGPKSSQQRESSLRRRRMQAASWT